MKIGIFGGSFDPIHNSHLYVATTALRELKLDKVLFVPCRKSPLPKKLIRADTYARLNMLTLALKEKTLNCCYSNLASFEIEECELERKGKSFTIDTIKYLKEKYPNGELYLLIGKEAPDSLDTWKDIDKIKDLVQIKVAGIDYDIQYTNISSTMIRDLVKRGKSISHLVPKDVEWYIEMMKLYRGKNAKN